MSKYLQLLLLAAFALSFNILNAQETESSETDEKSQEEEEETKLISRPSLVPGPESTGIESSGLVQSQRLLSKSSISSPAALSVISNAGISSDLIQVVGASGIAASEIVTLGSVNIKTLTSGLTGTAAGTTW